MTALPVLRTKTEAVGLACDPSNCAFYFCTRPTYEELNARHHPVTFFSPKDNRIKLCVQHTESQTKADNHAPQTPSKHYAAGRTKGVKSSP